MENKDCDYCGRPIGYEGHDHGDEGMTMGIAEEDIKAGDQVTIIIGVETGKTRIRKTQAED